MATHWRTTGRQGAVGSHAAADGQGAITQRNETSDQASPMLGLMNPEPVGWKLVIHQTMALPVML